MSFILLFELVLYENGSLVHTFYDRQYHLPQHSLFFMQVLSFCDRESAKPPHSRPQSPSFLGHVVGKRGRLQIKPSGSGDENEASLNTDNSANFSVE